MATINVPLPAGPRKAILVVGVHGPVKIRTDLMSRDSLRMCYQIDASSPGLEVRYDGHKEDLAAVGALPCDARYDRLCDDGHGGIWWLTSKAGKGRRGFVSINYYSSNRAFLRSLPGVIDLCPDELLRISSRARLHLVVDNTRLSEVAHGQA